MKWTEPGCPWRWLLAILLLTIPLATPADPPVVPPPQALRPTEPGPGATSPPSAEGPGAAAVEKDTTPSPAPAEEDGEVEDRPKGGLPPDPGALPKPKKPKHPKNPSVGPTGAVPGNTDDGTSPDPGDE